MFPSWINQASLYFVINPLCINVVKYCLGTDDFTLSGLYDEFAANAITVIYFIFVTGILTWNFIPFDDYASDTAFATLLF